MCFAAEVRPTVLVTGANRGLGLEYATRFAARGYHVIGTARDPEDAAELKSVGADVFKLDVTSDEDIANLAQALEGQVIDILLNNAGMRTTKTRREDMMISFSVNTVGPLLISEALLPNLMLSKNPRIINVSSGVGILTGGTGKSGAYAGQDEKPNVVLIFADDLGYGDLGCYGATKIKTPNIDKLAREGKRFTDAHSASSVCTPSRYALLTGEYPHRKHLYAPVFLRTPMVIDTDQQTIASVMKDAGYATACVGKWHLGFGTKKPTDWNAELKPGPLELGFDYFFGLPVVNSHPPFVYVENHEVVGADPKDPFVYGKKAKTKEMPEKMNVGDIGGADAAHALYQDEFVATKLTEKATDWIKQQDKKPFFLYLATTNIHHPFTPAPKFAGTSEAGVYGDFVQELDWMVGEVMKTLEEQGVADNTMVIITSDNGGMLNETAQETVEMGHAINGKLLGAKFDAWDGGHRVPFITWWPGHIEAGSVSGEVICNVDTIATFADLTGRTLAEGQGQDSVSFLPVLTGETAKMDRDHLLISPFRVSHLSLRKGKWMYISGNSNGGFVSSERGNHGFGGPASLAFMGKENSNVENGKLRPDLPPGQLYDMEKDPYQTKNVYLDFPEVVSEMNGILESYQTKGTGADARAGEPVSIGSLLQEMVDRDHVARFPENDFRLKQESSYNRASKSPDDPEGWFNNKDNNTGPKDDSFIRIDEKNGEKEWVLMDHKGAGAIVRTWMPFRSFGRPSTKIRIRIYLDGSEEPALEGNMLGLLDGTELFPYPFAHKSIASAVSFFPIPYAKGCKITTTEMPFFYQFTFREYAEGADVKTFNMADYEAAAPLIKEVGEKLLAPAAEKAGDPIEFSGKLAKGEEKSLDLPGGVASVRELSMKLGSYEDTDVTRKVVLKMEFDGKETVWCPIGDFFGSGIGLNPFQGWYRTVAEDGTMTSRWVMPYRESGKISIVNLGEEPVDVEMAVKTGEWEWDENSMYFHAQWRGQYPVPTMPHSDWNYITTNGRGVYVGDTLTIMNPVEKWWGEGDEKIWVDGESFPSIFGTGTEDYYGYSWGGAATDFYDHPFHAQPRAHVYNKLNRKPKNLPEKNTQGYSVETRSRALDTMPFATSLQLDMEVWSWNDCDMGYGVGVYWYGDAETASNRKPEPVEALNVPPLPDMSKGKAGASDGEFSGAIEFEDLKVLSKPDKVILKPQPLKGFKGKWNRENHLLIKNAAEGDVLEFEIPSENPVAEKIVLFGTTAKDFANLKFTVNAKEAGKTVDFYSKQVASTGPIDLGEYEAIDGKHTLRIEVLGKNTESKSMAFGLDCLRAEADPRSGERPNVIVIMADDLGYHDLGCYGNKDIPTPHIDSLAEQGTRFTSGYVTWPMCGPSRAGFLTGKYQSTFGYYRNVSQPFDPSQGLPEIETIASLMKAQGYATGGVGKWHMGTTDDQRPESMGFDDWFGFYGGGLMYFPLDHPNYKGRYTPLKRPASGRDLQHTMPVVHNGKPVEWDQYLTRELTDAGVAFLEKNRQQPFFLFMSYNAPHLDLEAPEESIAKFPPDSMSKVPGIKPESRSIYAAMIHELDQGVGQLLARLDELGLAENTVIWFLSDNGGLTKVTENGPLKAGKGSPYEGGLRVPMIVKWPGKIPAGVVRDEPVTSLDITATSVASSGGDVAAAGLHGKDIRAFLTGETSDPPHDILFWNLGKSHGDRAGAVRDGNFKLIIGKGKPQLFDLSDDLGETTNLAASQPERPNIVFVLIDDLGAEAIGAYGGESYETPEMDRLAEKGMRFDNAFAQPMCMISRATLMSGQYGFRTGLPKNIDEIARDGDGWGKGEFVTDGPEVFGPDVFCKYITDFMAAHKDDEQPFFAYYPMVLVHSPWPQTPDNLDQPQPGWKPEDNLREAETKKPSVQNHKAMVEYTDQLIGRVAAAIDDLGIAEDTLLIVTADNGTYPGYTSRYDGDALRGGKGSVTDIGTRVPFFAVWKGRIVPGSVNTNLVDFTDFLPTLVELGGGTLPENAKLDGQSFLGQMLGEAGAPAREWIFAGNLPKAMARADKFSLDVAGQLFDLRENRYAPKPRYETTLKMIIKPVVAMVLAVLPVFSAEPFTPREDLEALAKVKVDHDPELPNVLLWGDSISIGYTRFVIPMLAGRANVSRIDGNSGDSSRGLERAGKWLGETKWDVIHFNHGLHDLCYRHPDSKVQGKRDKVHGRIQIPIEQYGRNLEELVGELEKTGATLIWASTTVVPEGEAGRFVGDEVKYNAVAENIMKSHGIEINDLHALTETFDAGMFSKPGDVHYNEEGYAKIAGQPGGKSISALENELKDAESELTGLSRLSIYGGVGPIGYRSSWFEDAEHPFWVKIDLGEETMVDQIIVVPALSRTAQQGIHADGLPQVFDIVVGAADGREETVVAGYRAAERDDSGIAPLVFTFPPAIASWVRIEAPRLGKRAYDGRFLLQLSEVFAFSGERNVALRKPVTVSEEKWTEASNAWSPGFLVDGVTPYLMDSKRGEGTLPYVSEQGVIPTMTIDLGEPGTFSEIRLHAIDQSDTVPQSFAGDLGIPRHMRIEGADRRDFSDARVLLDVRRRSIYETGPILAWNIPEVTCRYVRLRELDSPGSANVPEHEERLGLAEWELIHEGKNIALGKTAGAGDSSANRPGSRPMALTDGCNRQGEILPVREWMNELARRHELETRVDALRKALNARYLNQKSLLAWMTRIAAGLVILIGIVIFYSRVMREKNEARVRERIAANLHDELGANLHAIGLLGDIAEESVGIPERLIETVRRIRGLTERTSIAAKNCTNMLEAKGFCEDLVHEMKEDAQRLLADLDYRIHIEGGEPLNRLRRRQRIDFFLFYKECLTNIIRHAHATRVEIHVAAVPGKVTLAPIEILLVEDNREYREVIEFALDGEPLMELTGHFSTAETALEHIQDMARVPDVILLDLRLPGMSGLEALPYFREKVPGANVLVISQSDDEADVLRAIALGATGYLLKVSTIGQIKEGIRTVHAGGSSLDPKVARHLTNALKGKPLKAVAAHLLSEREMEILELLADGLQKKEIGKLLNLGYSTVDTYVRRIYEKLEVRNAPAAVRKAYQTGIF
eukprot:g3951.t1